MFKMWRYTSEAVRVGRFFIGDRGTLRKGRRLPPVLPHDINREKIMHGRVKKSGFKTQDKNGCRRKSVL